MPQQECARLTCTIDWNLITVESGMIFGHGIVFAHYSWFGTMVSMVLATYSQILCWIFPQMYLEYVTQSGQTYETLRWWH